MSTSHAQTLQLDPRLIDRAYEDAGASRWSLSKSVFAAALEAGAGRAIADRPPAPADLDRYVTSLHLEDVALACACAEGDGAAWDHFVLQFRPVLYRAADALDPSGGAREQADSLYADLFGLQATGEGRTSLLRYFHGRSSLATWLRSVLAQRYVDRIRSARRLVQLDDDDPPLAGAAVPAIDPDLPRWRALMGQALERAVAELPDRDRLRLNLYYAQQLTLAETGRVLKEHEATASRQLARTRTVVRKAVEHNLATGGLTPAEVARCFESVVEDAGSLDLEVLLGAEPGRKESAQDRSKEGKGP